METNFDPYRMWLGIHPKHQPPHHYRLLGIPLFESDLDVIENAADRQMAHLRTFQLGQNRDLSQKLLNEIAFAKVCLLDPVRKKEYDAALRLPENDSSEIFTHPLLTAPPALTAPPVAQPPIPVGTVVSTDSPIDEPPLSAQADLPKTVTPRVARTSFRSHSRHRGTPPWLIIVCSLGLLLIALLVLILILQS